MAEPSPLDTILGVLQVQIKTKDDARFALEHVSTFFIPTTNHSAASSRHVLDHVLGALMSQISNEIDAAFALRRISNLHASIVANLAKAQESGASQNAKSSSSSASFALDAISSQSAKTEASAFAKSEAPKLSSTVPAPSNITARQAPTSVNSEAPKPLSATPALSKTTLQRPPTSTKSGAPKLSSDTPALPNITPQQPPAPLVTSRVLPEKPKGPTCSAEQLPTSPYVLTSMYTPARGDRLSYELAKCVGPYQDSSSVVLSKLIKHGGRNHHPKGYRRGAPLAQRLDYYDYSQRLRSMAVQRDVFDDHNGWRINIPYVSCNQYLDLYNSMVHRNPGNMHTICREILDELEIAISNRADVYKWYESLPATDDRVPYNPRHLAFLQMFEKLEHAINRFLLTNTPQLIRR
jgi:hypothetical protein